MNDTRQLTRHITWRYLLAVSLIALLSTGAYFTLRAALDDSQSTAYIVNISGKQRMLSQHIALDAHRLHQQRHINAIPSQALEQAMQARIDEMRQANKNLSSGQLDQQTSVTLSPEIRSLYFGQPDLFLRVNDYLALAERQLTENNPEISLYVLRQLDALSEPLLKDLNRAVAQYQLEGENRLARISTMEVMVWSLTLMTLLLEVLYIFRPMVKEVRRSREAEQSTVDNLKDLVELRTMKLKDANTKLEKLASLDPLTGLKNRMTLEADIEALIEAFHHHGQPFALAMLDIDWFKKINDNHGHDAGDAVLKEFAGLLGKFTRESDQVYRSGGEEFVLILNRIDFKQVEIKLESLRETVEQHDFNYQALSIEFTISIGYFHTSQLPVENVHQVLKLADNALYQAKSEGRNRVSGTTEHQRSKLKHLGPSPSRIQFHDSSLSRIDKVDYDIEAVTGYPAAELLDGSVTLTDMLYTPDRDLLELIQQQLNEQGTSLQTVRIQTRERGVRIFRLQASLDDESHVNLSLQDATALASPVRDEMLVSDFHAMLERSNDYIYFKDRNHVFTAASKTLVSLASVDRREDLVGKTDYDVFPREYADEYFRLEKKVFVGELDVAQEYQPTLDTQGNKGWVDNRKYPIKDARGKIIGLFGIARIISDEEYRKTIEAQKEA